MKPATNVFLSVVAVCSLVIGNAETRSRKSLADIGRTFDSLYETNRDLLERTLAPVQRPTIDVRYADWSPVKLPSTVQPVSYAGGCRDGSCSILGLHRSGEVVGDGSGRPVLDIVRGLRERLRERQPVRRLFGRLFRGRCG